MTSPGGAQHYIYIEQQYFISDTGEGASVNRLAEAILKRVQWAIECQRTFRVFVVIPDQLEADFVLEPVSYFTRRTLLQVVILI